MSPATTTVSDRHPPRLRYSPAEVRHADELAELRAGDTARGRPAARLAAQPPCRSRHRGRRPGRGHRPHVRRQLLARRTGPGGPGHQLKTQALPRRCSPAQRGSRRRYLHARCARRRGHTEDRMLRGWSRQHHFRACTSARERRTLGVPTSLEGGCPWGCLNELVTRSRAAASLYHAGANESGRRAGRRRLQLPSPAIRFGSCSRRCEIPAPSAFSRRSWEASARSSANCSHAAGWRKNMSPVLGTIKTPP